MINVSTDHSSLRRHTKPIHSEWPHPSGGSLSPHRKSPFSRNGHTPQAEAFHLIEKAHSVGMATPPRRKPFTSSKKPIQSEWPHPPGGSLSPHRKSPFSRNGHTPQAEASHLIEKAHSFGMATFSHLHLYDTTICPRSWPVYHLLSQNG